MTFYFDNAATTKIKQEVIKQMMPFLTEEYGNPSSLYHIGRSAKRAIDNARNQVAGLINCDKNEIYFTGCGTESDNTAIKGIAYKNFGRGRHIITSKIEHPAVLNTCHTLEKQGLFVTYLDVNKEGFIDLNQLIRSIRNDTILISIMFANNEIGTIQDIEEIARIAKMYNIIFHTDAVQACGNIPIDVKKMGIDMLSLSGHKFHAPKGIGALYVKKGIEFKRFMDGGHQEKEKRASTENVAGIVGLGKASEIALNNSNKHIEYLSNLRNYYISQVQSKVQGAVFNGPKEKRLPVHLTLNQSKQLLSNVINSDVRNKVRNYAIVCIFLNCGLRLSELVGINLSDLKIDNSEKTIRIRGKGSKERILYLDEAVCEAIELYLEVRPKLGKDNPDYNALFISSRNKRLSQRAVQVLIKAAFNELFEDADENEKKKYHTHTLRHTSPTLLYEENDVNIFVLKKILGHESLEATQIYTHVSNKKLKELMLNFNILDREEQK